MIQAVARWETSRSMIHDPLPAVTYREEEAEIFSNDSYLYPASANRAAQLLVLGSGLGLTTQEWRDTFSGPAYQVIFVPTGAAGLHYLRSHAPDVILLDLQLPDQAGLEIHQHFPFKPLQALGIAGLVGANQLDRTAVRGAGCPGPGRFV